MCLLAVIHVAELQLKLCHLYILNKSSVLFSVWRLLRKRHISFRDLNQHFFFLALRRELGALCLEVILEAFVFCQPQQWDVC